MAVRGGRVCRAVRRRWSRGGGGIGGGWERLRGERTSTGRCLGVERRVTGRVARGGRARRHGVASFGAEVGDCLL